MSYTSKLIIHSDASNELLEEIATIKSTRWSYSLEKQLEWMNNNLSPNDLHLLVYQNDVLIAYTNFVIIEEVIINDIATEFKGIGNVCTSESGKRYGDVLMKSINNSILDNSWNGILLCKDNLVPYYSKYNWKLIPSQLVESGTLKEINTMVFNFDAEIKSLNYFDRNF